MISQHIEFTDDEEKALDEAWAAIAQEPDEPVDHAQEAEDEANFAEAKKSREDKDRESQDA